MNDPHTKILDAYNHYIYPADGFAKRGIDYDVSVKYEDNDSTYLNKVGEALNKAVQEF